MEITYALIKTRVQSIMVEALLEEMNKINN
jgi:hypothetical protein